MLPVIVGLLVVVPLVEIYVLIQVGQLLGAVPTLLLLVAMSVLGGVLLRREGARTWRALQDALRAHRVPANEVADGALVIMGGSLLLTPGFVSDAVGLLCVLPGSRALVRRAVLALVLRRFGAASVAGAFAADRAARRPRGHDETPAGGASGEGSVRGEVVEGEVVDGQHGPDEPPERS
jgi:UPF0716 protein FxsA